MYKAIIFDFFDVIHSDPYKRWLEQHGFKREGIFEESARLVDTGEISHEEHYKQVSKASGQDPESIRAIFNDTSLIDPAVVALIKELGGRYKVGLLSNASGPYIRPILEEHHLTDLFDEIIVSAEVGAIKPDPEIFHHALKQLRVQPSEAVFTDDNPTNVAAAEKIGLHGIVFTSEKALRQELTKLKIV